MKLGPYKEILKMAKYKVKTGYSEKDMPVKIVLGNTEQAINVLSEILDFLRGDEPKGQSQFSPEAPTEEDIPF